MIIIALLGELKEMKLNKRKLLLVNPSRQGLGGLTQDESIRMMPLALGIIAALTPDDWEVELLDENYEAFTYKQADLVGFTSFTANAPRAYEIAAIYRQKGIHTVMGGVHASMCTSEVMRYVDTVVSGEAESAWPNFLSDFNSGNAKNLYIGDLIDVKDVPFVRRDIYNKYPYVYDLVQTSRGCPMGCDFCSVTQLCGNTYRERNIEDVLDELEQTTRSLLFFVDDNLINQKKGAQERAIKLFKGMVERKMNKLWLSQAALNFADSDELLYWARKSGCIMILLGVEAEKDEALKDMNKKLNLKKGVQSYEPIFRKVHKHGIGILASMIFAMESDTLEDLYVRRDFIKNSSVDSYQITILTPIPGTALYNRMEAQNRIVATNYPNDWILYDGTKSVLTMPHLSTEQTATAMKDIWLSLYSKEPVRRRLFQTLWRTKSFKTSYWAYGINHAYSRMCLEGTYNIDNKTSKKRSLYLRLTDRIVWLLYQVAWKDITRSFAGK